MSHEKNSQIYGLLCSFCCKSWCSNPPFTKKSLLKNVPHFSSIILSGITWGRTQRSWNIAYMFYATLNQYVRWVRKLLSVCEWNFSLLTIGVWLSQPTQAFCACSLSLTHTHIGNCIFPRLDKALIHEAPAKWQRTRRLCEGSACSRPD